MSSKSQPILLVIVACSLTTLLGVGQSTWNLTRPWPVHQWESGLVSQSQRVATGLPVFEPASSGHATHMYGPLTDLLVGTTFRIFGPSLLPGRLLSLASLIAALVILISATRPAGVRVCVLVVIATFACFGRAMNSYIEIRPDCSSVLFGLISVCCLYKAHKLDSGRWLAAGSMATVIAMLFKQPAAMVAAVPIAGLILNRKAVFRRRRLLFLATPFVCVAGTLAILRLGFPIAYHYMIGVPSTFKVSASDCVSWLGWFALVTSVFWASLLWVRQQWPTWKQMDQKTAWLLAATLVTTSCCVLTAGKQGGTANSLLPALFAVAGLFLHLSTRLEQQLAISAAPAIVVAMLLFLPVYLTARVSPNETFGDSGFNHLVTFARQHPDSRFVSPYDPALAVMAGHSPGRSIMLEYDAAGWPEQIPAWFFSELAHSDYAVTVAGWRAWPLSTDNVEHIMQARGFERIALPALSGSAYRLWSRSQ